MYRVYWLRKALQGVEDSVQMHTGLSYSRENNTSPFQIEGGHSVS